MTRTTKANEARAAKLRKPRPYCRDCGSETAPQNKMEKRAGRFWCSTCRAYPSDIIRRDEPVLRSQTKPVRES